MKRRIFRLTLLALVMLIAVPQIAAAQGATGAAAFYSPSYDGAGWVRIFNLQRSWGNGIAGAVPDPNGYWCVKPGYEVGQRLSLSANGVSITCTIGDYVQVHHQQQWHSRWVVELSWSAFKALRLDQRNVVTVRGLARTGGRGTQQASESPRERCEYFDVTGYSICHGFQAFWHDNGGLMVFGYPLTNEFDEDGLTVQYFERAVFEWHPDNDPAHQVLLRRLGAEVLHN